MITKIELDEIRISKYQEFKNNLEAVKEYFRHGDILIKEVNNILVEIKNNIDNNIETSFTKDDFNDMLSIRNSVLIPIFQNASFAMEFIPYDDNIQTQPVSAITTQYQVSEGKLISSIVTEKNNDVIIKTTYLTYDDNNLVESKIIIGNNTEILKYIDNKLIKSTLTEINGNVAEITIKTFENNALLSTEFFKYENGLLI